MQDELNKVSRALAAATEEKRQLAVKKTQLEEEAQAMKEDVRQGREGLGRIWDEWKRQGGMDK